jgi:predicted metal-dependent HD superfamily phosphohydrolase
MNKLSPFLQYKDILEKYLSPKTIFKLKEAWNEPRRRYHNEDHLYQILKDLEKSKSKVSSVQWESLVIAAFFHDAIYVPGNSNNEDQSIKVFLESFLGKRFDMVKAIKEMIKATQFRVVPADKLVKIFWEADNAGFQGPFESFLETEKKIRLEFGHVSLHTYKKGRLKFLNSCLGLMGPKADENVSKLIEYIEKNY